MSKKIQLGFKEGFEYVLSLLSYAYYVKGDSIVSDLTFDELEKVYCLLTGEKNAPTRACEREEQYSKGTKYLYYEYKKRQEELNENNSQTLYDKRFTCI